MRLSEIGHKVKSIMIIMIIGNILIVDFLICASTQISFRLVVVSDMVGYRHHIAINICKDPGLKPAHYPEKGISDE